MTSEPTFTQDQVNSMIAKARRQDRETIQELTKRLNRLRLEESYLRAGGKLETIEPALRLFAMDHETELESPHPIIPAGSREIVPNDRLAEVLFAGWLERNPWAKREGKRDDE